MDSQGEEENPFTLPPDDEIFTLREQERKKRAEERERDKHLKVHQKTTSASRIHRIKRFKDDEVAEKKDEEKPTHQHIRKCLAFVRNGFWLFITKLLVNQVV